MPRRIITVPVRARRACVCVRVHLYIRVCVCVCAMPMRPAEQRCVRGSSRLLRGAARMRVEVKWGVINLNEVQLFSHLLIIAG